MANIISKIRSGGQTGADRAALLVGRAANIPIGGWCPAGGWAEDMNEAPGLLEEFPEMEETPERGVAQRTEWNARDADVTLIFGYTQDAWYSPGTSFTSRCAEQYDRPYLIITKQSPREVMEWLAKIGEDLEVNFAGPRESEHPGLQMKTMAFIEEMLDFN